MKLSNPELELQKKIKYFILTLILLISVKVCFSQYNFIPGYIISVDGDTLNGEILDQDYILSSQTVVYRENDSSARQYFIPKDIHSYYISDGRYYETRIFEYYQEIPVKELQLTVNTSKESPKRSAFEIVKDTAFLRVVVKGKGEILLYTDAIGRVKYYAETPKGGLKQLIKDKTYYLKNNGGIGFRTKNTIKDTLQYLTSDCKQDLYFERRSKIYLTDLIDLMMDYNTCINSESEIIQPRQKIKARIGFNVGRNTTNLIIKGEQPRLYEKSEYNPGHGYFLGLIVDWYLNKTHEKWIFQTELCYTQKQSDQIPYEIYYWPVYNNGVVRDSTFDSTRYTVNASYLDLCISGKYFLNNRIKTIRPYITGGIIIGVSLDNWNKFERIRYKNGHEYMYYPTRYAHIEAGILGKFGVLINVKKRFGIYTEIRGSFTRLFIDGRDDKLQWSLYNFTLGIFL